MVRPADVAARGDAQQLHDLVAVQLRAQRVDLFLLRQHLDPVLQIVVRGPQPGRARLVPGGAVGPGQDVQPDQLVAGVAYVAPHRGIGPLPRFTQVLAVAVEAQVQRDQVGDRPHHLSGVAQRREPLPYQLRAHHIVVMERNLAARLEPPGRRLADVVQQRGQPVDQVGPTRRAHLEFAARRQPGLQRDRLLEHGQAVLVHVLVLVVLVPLQPQRRQFREHPIGQTGRHQQIQTGPRLIAQQQPAELVADPLGGDDRDPVGHVGHRLDHLRRRRKPQLGREPRRTHHPQRVVAERDLRSRGRPDHPVGQVAEAGVRVVKDLVRDGNRHRVDGEVPPGQVAVQGVPEFDHRLAAVLGVRVGAEGRDFDDPAGLAVTDLGPDGAELPADGPHRRGESAQQGLDVIRPGRGGEIQVVLQSAEQGVADAAPDQIDLVPGGGEQLAEPIGDGGDPQQLGHCGRLRRIQPGRRHADPL